MATIKKSPFKFLVTGCNSYLGRLLIRELNIKYTAWSVIATDIKEPPRSLGCDFEKMDVQDEGQVAEQFEKVKPTHIVHLAMNRAMIKSTDDNSLNSKVGLENILKQCHLAKAKVLFPSSIAAYESSGMQSHYSTELKECENLCKEYSQLKGLDIRILRLPFVAGFIQRQTYHMPYDIVTQLFMKGRKIGFVSLPIDKDKKLPMIAMDDAVKAMMLLIDADKSKLNHLAYDINGASYDLVTLATHIKKIMYSFRYEVTPQSQLSEEDAMIRDIIKGLPSTLEDEAARKDWGWNYVPPKKIKDFAEKILEEIVDYSN